MEKRKLLKSAQKLKYYIEKTYEVELQLSDSELDENNTNIMFVSCHVGITARNNQKIHFLYRICSYFNPLPLHHIKKNKRIWCLEPLIKEEQSINKRAFLEEGTKNKGKAMSPELKDENSRIFPGKKGVCVARIVKKSWTTLLEYPYHSSVLGSFSQGSLRNSFIVLCMVVKGDWVKI